MVISVAHFLFGTSSINFRWRDFGAILTCSALYNLYFLALPKLCRRISFSNDKTILWFTTVPYIYFSPLFLLTNVLTINGFSKHFYHLLNICWFNLYWWLLKLSRARLICFKSKLNSNLYLNFNMAYAFWILILLELRLLLFLVIPSNAVLLQSLKGALRLWW